MGSQKFIKLKRQSHRIFSVAKQKHKQQIQIQAQEQEQGGGSIYITCETPKIETVERAWKPEVSKVTQPQMTRDIIGLL